MEGPTLPPNGGTNAATNAFHRDDGSDAASPAPRTDETIRGGCAGALRPPPVDAMCDRDAAAEQDERGEEPRDRLVGRFPVAHSVGFAESVGQGPIQGPRDR